MSEPRKWLYGLTADEWLLLASAGQDSEVGPCCGNIGQLREWLQALTTCQGEGESHLMLRSVLEAYDVALSDHDTIADEATFPLLHRVISGARKELADWDRECAESRERFAAIRAENERAMPATQED